MSTYVMHHAAQTYGVQEKTEDLLVWRSAEASASSAAYLVAFLNAHCRNIPPYQVRRILCGLGSELQPLDAPPDAVTDPLIEGRT